MLAALKCCLKAPAGVRSVQRFLASSGNTCPQEELPIISKATTAPSATAERMRLYRKRRQQGLQYVRIPLRVTEIDGFVRMGYLRQEERQDHEALRAAVLFLIHLALDDVGDF